MKQIKVQLEIIVPLLVALWTDEHDELIMEMKNQMRVDDLGHRYSGIEGAVVSGLPQSVADYKIVCEKDNADPLDPPYIKEAESNLLGRYKIKSMKPGLYTVKLVDPAGVVVNTSIVTIKRGVTMDFNWTV